MFQRSNASKASSLCKRKIGVDLNKIKFFKVYGTPKDVSFGEELEMDVDIERPSKCRTSGHWLAVCNEPDKASIIDIERQTVNTLPLLDPNKR